MAVRSFDSLKSEYAALWAGCTIRPQHKNEVFKFANEIRVNRPLYDEISKRTNGVPWYLIGIIHAMECSHFPKPDQHLHNGDPLRRDGKFAKTRLVPPNRPAVWPPADDIDPFVASAIDALTMPGKQFDKVKDWSIERICFTLETYNGWGYRGRNVNSAYLWSYTNNYTCGKYVRDHVWSSTVVSDQCGGMALLKALIELDPMAIDQHPPAVDTGPSWPKAEEQKPVFAAVAAGSWTVRAKIAAMVAAGLSWLEQAVGWLPEIKDQSDTLLAPMHSLLSALKLNFTGITAIVVLVCGVIVISRHTRDKAELQQLKGGK